MNKTYIGDLKGQVVEQRVEEKTTHLYIDATELIYGAIEKFKQSLEWITVEGEYESEINRINEIVEKEMDENGNLINVVQDDETAYKIIMNKWKWSVELSIIMFLEDIKTMKNLEVLVVGFDGVPVYGKIQQQIERRKVGNKRYYYKDRLIFSSALILPEATRANEFITKFIELTTTFCEGKTLKYGIAVETANGKPSSVTFHNTTTQYSSSNIPGEAEHKVLCIFREHLRAGKLKNKVVVVWSADSDTIVSLIGDTGVELYVRTSVYEMKNKISALIKVDDFRNNILTSGTMMEYMIVILLFQFLGNDYLPEMFNTVDIRKFIDELYIHVRERFDNLLILMNGTYIINTPVLTKLFQHIATGEFASYAKERSRSKNAPQQVTSTQNFFSSFEAKGNLGMKRDYYTHLYKFYNVNTKSNPSDEDLYDLETEMALNYLEVFYWYFYYLNGYYMRGNLANPYYRFSHPPLYESLHQMLRDGSIEQHARFNYQANKDLEPIRTTHAYYESLPHYPMLHHYMVLPKEEFDHEYPISGLQDDDVLRVRNSKVKPDPYFTQRNSSVKKPMHIVHVDRIKIEQVIKNHSELLSDSSNSLIVSEREAAPKTKGSFILGGIMKFND